jgi:hypothetical protein
MSETSIDICSKALLLIGANTITSFEDETREAEVCNSLYNTIKESLLGNRLWSFSMEQMDLARLQQKPLRDYEYMFQIPKEVIRIKRSASGAYDIFGDKIYSNSPTMSIDCQVSVHESKMPAHFKKALISNICRDLSVSLLGDKEKFALFDGVMEKDLKTARMIDMQNTKNKKYGSDSFFITVVR